MTLWTLEDAAEAMGARVVGKPRGDISGVSIDTRTIESGDLYFALHGENHDGHDFVLVAGEGGAAAAVVDREDFETAMPLLVVEDTLVAMERLGVAARARTQASVVAVTGSAGKTTTKEMMRHGFARLGATHVPTASFNNHWGVPLTLARMPEGTRFAISEIGMNHPDEIRPLVKLARPHVAVITLIAGAHMGAFDSLDGIARAKAEIFEGVEPGGTAVLNIDDGRFALLSSIARAWKLPVMTFGRDARADVRLASLDGRRFSAEIAGRTVAATLSVDGDHMVMNALAVLAAAHALRVDVDAVASGLVDFTAGAGRGARLEVARDDGAITIIDESYNANPASMRAAIAQLADSRPGEGGRRVAVLGDMLELGDHSRALHAELGDVLCEHGISRVLLAGPEMAHLRDALATHGDVEVTWRETTPELATIIRDEVHGHDVVMLKSSLGLRFATLVDALKG